MEANKSIFERSRVDQQAALWLLRSMFRRSRPSRSTRNLFNDGDVQEWLLGEPMDGEYRSDVSERTDYTNQIVMAFRKTRDALEERYRKRAFYPPSVGYVGQHFGLNETECRLLWLAVVIYDCQKFRDIMNLYDIEMAPRIEAARYLGMLTDQPHTDVLRALSPTARLTVTGLMKIRSNHFGLDSYFIVPHKVAMTLRDESDPATILNAFLYPAKTTELTEDHYPHLWDDLVNVSTFLDAAIASREPGVNILFYGPPGLGKTELAAVIAERINTPLYMVPGDHELKGDDEDDRQERLSAYRMSQTILSTFPRALLVFDDVEDGLLGWAGTGWESLPNGKASLNLLLESNPVPAIWITNVADRFDPAHLRRFAYVVQFNTPPRAVRQNMVSKAFDGIPVSVDWQNKVAQDRDLTPTQLHQVRRVVGCVARHHDTADTHLDNFAHHVYRGNYKLRFGREPDYLEKPSQYVDFDAGFLNCSTDPQQIIAAFRQSRSMTACFYGPPGTGKSAFAADIARELDVPLIVKRASDLLRPHVGETEMLLRGMFEEARDENALLLLDEADSFLADREKAYQRWEVTQVNELLTQIERYSGWFIATSNAFNTFDAAAIRRFVVKARFDAMTTQQAWALFTTWLERFGLAVPDDRSLARQALVAGIQALAHLTPGDFAVVGKRLSICPPRDAHAFLDALRDEHRHKKHSSRSIGFTA